MGDNFKNIIIFAAGAIIGSAVTWKIVKDKYEQIAQEEIDSVKEVFARRREEESTERPKLTEDGKAALNDIVKDKPALSEFAALLAEEGYVDEEGGTSMGSNEPYVISPDELGELDGYETVTLFYYADEVLADEMDEIIEDVDDIVGSDSLNRFGEYEDDSVFVRNDRLKTDYEILIDTRHYWGDIVEQEG